MIEIRDLRFHYDAGGFALDIPALHIAPGEKVAFIGPSGVGKTTLLSLMAGILRPDRGSIRVAGVDLSARSDAARRKYRIARIGLVFQEFELLEYLTVRDNILLPAYVNAALPLTSALRTRAADLATGLGIGDKLKRRPRTLSQGERQRVAICRALIAEPELLLADEPTGNLDPPRAREIIDLLIRETERHNATLVAVTHNHRLLDAFDRAIDVTTLLREVAS